MTRCVGLFRDTLCVDTKAHLSSGHRYFEWGMPRMFGFAKAHMANDQEYPMKNISIDSIEEPQVMNRLSRDAAFVGEALAVAVPRCLSRAA